MFKTNVNVYFYDADPAGIIFYANIFKLAHIAFEEMMRSFSLKTDYFTDEQVTIPLLHAEADYISPIKAGDHLAVEAAAVQLRENSFEMSYRFYDETGSLKAEVKTVHVCVDKSGFKKTRLPEELSSKLKEV